MNKYSFIVDLGKTQKKDKIYNQILICSCGNKQKSKITVKRTILKNTETLYEDKYSVEEIKCNNCKEQYDILNNLYGIKYQHNILVEIGYEREEIKLNKNHLFLLKKNKLYYYFDYANDELKNFVLTDFLIYDKKNRELKYYIDESMLSFNLFDENLNSVEKYRTKNLKQNKLKVFDLQDVNFINGFFDFDETINYLNLENCFNYYEDLLKNTYEYEMLMNEKFLNNFKISSKIHELEENGIIKKIVYNRDPFGTNKLVVKKLNVGDYLNKLIKLSNITSIFLDFPSISSLYKTKGLDFIISGFQKGFFCSSVILQNNNATNTNKILECCCKFYFKNDKVELNVNQSEDFKFSHLIIKNINDSEDALVLYRFYKKNMLNKQEIENIFLKFDSQSIIKVFSKIVYNPNIRSVKLDIRHISHILKNKIFNGEHDEWLNIYYDTINTLNLIVGILKDKKDESKSFKKYSNLTRISENKLFEIKNYDKLRELHDEMFAIYRAMEDESKDTIFRNVVKKYNELNSILNSFEFKVIPNLKELSQEGLIMKHCIYTYLNDILNGGYLAIRVKDKISKEKATMGLKISDKKLHLQQLKGYENSRPTALLITTVLNYCEQFKIIVESNQLHRSDIQPNESLEKRMKNYLPKLKALEMRKKMNEKK